MSLSDRKTSIMANLKYMVCIIALTTSLHHQKILCSGQKENSNATSLQPTITSGGTRWPINITSPVSVLPTDMNDITCNINVTDDAVQALYDAFRHENVFIFITLHTDVEQIYGNKSITVIDPFVWVWALEGKGYVLLQFPYDFEYLSLTTLSIGVAHITINVSLAGDDCFQKASDVEREVMLAYLFIDAALEANDTLTVNDTDLYLGKRFRVCQEMFAYMPNTENDWKNIQNTRYYCHYYCSDTNGWKIYDMEPPKQKRSLLIRIGVVIASFFSPLLLILISQQNPPKEQEGERYFAINSDLPIGIHYWLFHSYRKSKCAFLFRTFCGTLTLLLLGILIHVVPLFAYRTSYFLHNTIITRGLPQYTVIFFAFITATCVFYLIFACFYWKYPDRFASASKLTLRTMEIDSQNFVKYWNLKADSKLKIPSSYKNIDINIFLFILKHNFKQFLEAFGKAVSTRDIDLHKYTFSVVMGCIPVFKLYLICVRYSLALLISEGNHDTKLVTSIFVWLISGYVPLLICWNTSSFFLYFIEMIDYAYIGLLLNYEYFVYNDELPHIIVVVCSVVAFFNIYPNYSRLHRIVMKKAIKLQKSSSPTVRPAREPCGNLPEDEPRRHENVMMGSNFQYVTYIDDIPHVSEKLFKSCYKEFQPVISLILKYTMTVVFAFLVVTFSVDTLKSIGEKIYLAPLKNTLILLVTVAITPFLKYILTSDEERQCKEKAERQNIKKFLKIMQRNHTDARPENEDNDLVTRD